MPRLALSSWLRRVNTAAPAKSAALAGTSRANSNEPSDSSWIIVGEVGFDVTITVFTQLLSIAEDTVDRSRSGQTAT